MDSNRSKDLQRLWTTTYFSIDDETSDPVARGSKKADAYRSLIFQLHYARATKSIPPSCWEYFAKDLLQQYSQAVDDRSGLNNYAEGALALAAHTKNESSLWKSTLDDMTLDELMTFMPEGATLQEQVDDTELEELIDILNAEQTHPLSSAPSFDNLATNHEEVSMKDPAPFENECQNFSGVPRPTTIPSIPSTANRDYWKSSNLNAFQPSSSSCSVVTNSLRGSHTGFQNRDRDNPDSTTLEQSINSMPFRTAREQLVIEQHRKPNRASSYDPGPSRKCLGSRRGLNSKFISPILNKQDNDRESNLETDITDDRLKNIDPKMVELITNEIMDHGPQVSWNDIAGLDFAKSTIKEIVVWPMLRPDIFRGLRGPPKGILLFGPPGTGKTMIGKCIASQSRSTFFNISASSLTSKWIGEGEKMVRALFRVARCHQPAVVFIDEIDSLLSQRSESEHESSRRLKTEFLVELDGATSPNDERLLVIGATNRPQELDEAARRRLVKRLYIPLPEDVARKHIVRTLLNKDGQTLSEEDLECICNQTKGYSGADMTNLCKEASLGPIRSLQFEDIEHISTDQVRPIMLQDFMDALKQVRASVSEKDLETYLDWNKQYGSINVRN